MGAGIEGVDGAQPAEAGAFQQGPYRSGGRAFLADQLARGGRQQLGHQLVVREEGLDEFLVAAAQQVGAVVVESGERPADRIPECIAAILAARGQQFSEQAAAEPLGEHRHQQQTCGEQQLADALATRVRVHHQSAEFSPRFDVATELEQGAGAIGVELLAVAHLLLDAQEIVRLLRHAVEGEHRSRAEQPAVIGFRHQGVLRVALIARALTAGQMGERTPAVSDDLGDDHRIIGQIDGVEQVGERQQLGLILGSDGSQQHGGRRDGRRQRTKRV